MIASCQPPCTALRRVHHVLAGPRPWWSGELGAEVAAWLQAEGEGNVAGQQLPDPTAASELVVGVERATGPTGLWLHCGT